MLFTIGVWVYNDGTMAQKEPNDTSYRELDSSLEVSGRIRDKANVNRVAGLYSYRLVHTQESIRLLDLRFDIAELPDVGDLGKLLSYSFDNIVRGAICGSLRLLDMQGGTRRDK